MTPKQKQVVEAFCETHAVLAQSDYCPPTAKEAGVRLNYVDHFDWSGDLPQAIEIKRAIVWPDGEVEHGSSKTYQEDMLQAVHEWLTVSWTFAETEDHEAFCERFGLDPSSGMKKANDQ